MSVFRVTTGVAFALAVSSWAYAGQAGASQQTTATPPQTAGAQTAGDQAKPPAKPEEQKVTRKEDVVVSASKTEQQLVDAPATMTVINEKTLALSPSGNYADILRNVPGTNITQISARDINVNQRGATSSLATGQLTVVDGRSVYLDFFGFTMWEFVPNDLDRDQADRSHSRAGIGRLGRECAHGRGQLHHQDPARTGGRRRDERALTFGVGTFNKAVNHNGAENGMMFYARATLPRP